MHANYVLPHVFQLILRVTNTVTAMEQQQTSNETKATAVKQQLPKKIWGILTNISENGS